jgi:hypothetical protein
MPSSLILAAGDRYRSYQLSVMIPILAILLLMYGPPLAAALQLDYACFMQCPGFIFSDTDIEYNSYGYDGSEVLTCGYGHINSSGTGVEFGDTITTCMYNSNPVSILRHLGVF